MQKWISASTWEKKVARKVSRNSLEDKEQYRSYVTGKESKTDMV